MKNNRFGIFTRISILVFALITVMSVLFIAITYYSTTHFYQASTQLLNRDVAAHIAKFTSPFQENGINKAKADSVFYNAMVISPSIEVYFLDTTGKVMYYQSPDTAIQLWHVPLYPIQTYISTQGKRYITGPDPKNPGEEKVFSAAEVRNHNKKLGYIYVVLAGKEYGNAAGTVFGSHVGTLAIKAFMIVLVLSLVISGYYFNRLQKNYRGIVTVLERYQNGDFNARFQVRQHNEFAPITESFNRMAERLYQTGKERKDFIANISHDLRTPLAVARGYTETLLQGINRQHITRQQEEEYTQLVHKKIDQVEKMVQQLFELSKMESLELMPVREPFIISELLDELVKSYQIAASEKNIRLTCRGCHETYWIFADVRMMERVIQNLLDNAIKYTPENGEVNVQLYSRANELFAEFENSGETLPQNLIDWINNNENYTRPAGISGLGLPIVKKILQLHDFPLRAERTSSVTRLSFTMKTHNASL